MIPYEHWATAPNPPTIAERRSGLFWFGLISALFLAIALSAGCAGSKPPVDERPNAQLIAPPVAVDTPRTSSTTPPGEVAQSTEKPGLFRRLFPKSTASTSSTIAPGSTWPRKFKGTINYYAPGSTVTTSTIGKKATAAIGEGASSTTIGKKAGPSITNSDSSTQAVTQGGAAAIGPGAHAEGGATVQEAAGFWGTLAKPLGYLACVVGAGAVVYLLYLIWAFLPRRKTNNQA